MPLVFKILRAYINQVLALKNLRIQFAFIILNQTTEQ